MKGYYYLYLQSSEVLPSQFLNVQAPIEYENSWKLSSQLVNNIKNHVSEYNGDINQFNDMRQEIKLYLINATLN